MPVIEDERAEARRLRDDEGKSERDIAAALGRANSTIHAWLAETPPADPEPDPIPGQLTTDGSEVPPASQNGNGPHIYVEEIRVDGTTQVSIDFGGKRAQTCKLTIRGSATVDGFFRKGDTVTGSFEAVIDGASAKDQVDKQTGIVTEARQTHTARIVNMRLD